MRILVVNDDGIRAEGISRLARMVQVIGEVWVVAPKGQCSAMCSGSQCAVSFSCSERRLRLRACRLTVWTEHRRTA